MELRHARYYIAVAEELSFTRAAERLHIAQPPLRRQIRQLEEEIGTPLLARDRRRVVLTPAGQLFLEEARKMVFTEHEKRFPLVEIRCKGIWSTLQNQALVDRTIDVGFLRPPVDRRLFSEHMFYEPVMVLTAKTNPLAKLPAVRLGQLAAETLLLPERSVSSGIYDTVLDIYRRTCSNPNIVHTQTGPYEEVGTMLVRLLRGLHGLAGGAWMFHALSTDSQP